MTDETKNLERQILREGERLLLSTPIAQVTYKRSCGGSHYCSETCDGVFAVSHGDTRFKCHGWTNRSSDLAGDTTFTAYGDLDVYTRSRRIINSRFDHRELYNTLSERKEALEEEKEKSAKKTARLIYRQQLSKLARRLNLKRKRR